MKFLEALKKSLGPLNFFRASKVDNIDSYCYICGLWTMWTMSTRTACPQIYKYIALYSVFGLKLLMFRFLAALKNWFSASKVVLDKIASYCYICGQRFSRLKRIVRRLGRLKSFFRFLGSLNSVLAENLVDNVDKNTLFESFFLWTNSCNPLRGNGIRLKINLWTMRTGYLGKVSRCPRLFSLSFRASKVDDKSPYSFLRIFVGKKVGGF